MSYRILFLGPDWHGSNSHGLSTALRRIGHTVCVVDTDRWVSPPRTVGMWGRVAFRLARRYLMRLKAKEILSEDSCLKPDIVVAYKSNNVTATLIRRLRKRRRFTVVVFPDVSFTAHGSQVQNSLEHYELVFTTKSFGRHDFWEAIGPGDVEYLPHGFDDTVHRPVKAHERDRDDFGADVSFIGTWSPKKEATLAYLAGQLGKIRIRIWGRQWEKASSPILKPRIEGQAVLGDVYALTVCCSKINLGLLSERRSGASSGDQITSRTFHIPGCGGFMLHERTADLEGHFVPGEEVGVFESDEDLVSQVRYYLEHDAERVAIAARGYAAARNRESLTSRAEKLVDQVRSRLVDGRRT